MLHDLLWKAYAMFAKLSLLPVAIAIRRVKLIFII